MFRDAILQDYHGKNFKGQAYSINEDDELVGCLFGHFAPFTGPKGHGRMISALRELGCKKFLIGIPEISSFSFDWDRNLFTLEQRAYLAEVISQDIGIESKVVILKRKPPFNALQDLARLCIKEYDSYNLRPILALGPDRKDLLDKFVPYDSEITSSEEGYPFEYVYLSDRGEMQTKAEIVRKTLIDESFEDFQIYTGISEYYIYSTMQNFIKRNQQRF